MSHRLAPTRTVEGSNAPLWCSDSGEVIACVEKIKVLNENLAELMQIAQDALEDGLLLGCSEAQMRHAFHDLIDRLVNPYAELAGTARQFLTER